MGSSHTTIVPQGDDAAPPSSSESRGHSAKTLLQLAVFYILALTFMGIHLVMFNMLDEKPVKTALLRQSIQGAIANFLALVAELMLLSGAGLAYEQILWRNFRHKTLSSMVVEKLVTLPGTPWDLAELQVIRTAWVPWLVALGCVMMPLAGMFPPGTLTVEFRNSVLETSLTNVQTMNISHWGVGTYRDFVNHALFDLDADMFFLKVQPRLETLAGTVLSQGRPVDPPTPCSGPCTYSLKVQGPRFRCQEVRTQNDTLFEPCAEKIFEAVTMEQTVNKQVFNNSFSISWQKEWPLWEKCDPISKHKISGMTCSTTLATYDIKITNAENGTSTFKTEISDDHEFWTNERPIQRSFYGYFYNETGDLRQEVVNKTQLTQVFAHSQAYAVSHAAVKVLEGGVKVYPDGGFESLSLSFQPNGSHVVASPYVGMTDRYDPRVHMSAETLQQYLQDLLISSMSLNPPGSPLWTNNDVVEAMEGGEVFLFDAKLQFFVPYGACLLVTFLIYVVGIRALLMNGGPADASIPQYAIPDEPSSPLDDDDGNGSIEKGGATEKRLLDHVSL